MAEPYKCDLHTASKRHTIVLALRVDQEAEVGKAAQDGRDTLVLESSSVLAIIHADKTGRGSSQMLVREGGGGRRGQGVLRVRVISLNASRHHP